MRVIKTYILTVATVFPKGHISEGKRTEFKGKILKQQKVHTIRENYAYWKGQIDKINEGKGLLSIRQWGGRPYNSKQHEFLQLQSVGIEKLDRMDWGWMLDGTLADITTSELATNDGLTMEEFKSWFRATKFENLALIYFTDFRYPKKNNS